MKTNKTPPQKSIRILQKTQRGIALMEALAAILLMSIGMLGILGVQMRTFIDAKTSVNRAKAIRLVEDLSEKIKINPNGYGNMATYLTTWQATPPARNCATTACNAEQLAASDIATWKSTVRATLPQGDAAVFFSADDPITHRRQLGVMLAWRQNERSNDASYLQPFNPVGNSGINCPANNTCHLQYISPTARCAPHPRGGIGAVIC